MRVLFIARATLFSVYGGDTVQMVSTAKYLQQSGIDVDIKLCNETIEYKSYDLLHFFNIARPADALIHVEKSRLPYVVSPIYVDYSEYQKQCKGALALLSNIFTRDQLEYLKVIARAIKNGEAVKSPEYLFLGQRRAIQKLAGGAAYLLPNSKSEYKRFSENYNISCPNKVVYNGIDLELFDTITGIQNVQRIPNQVICVARIEGRKNQLNLIKAMNSTKFNLKIIGKPAPNHMKYFNECKRMAAGNISFEDFVPQDQLMKYYRSSKVHVLPSWNETCGLSSLEAAYAKCNIVVTEKGDTREYFGNNAWYCEPNDIASIYDAIEKAAEAPINDKLYQDIMCTFNWDKAAIQTFSVYKEILNIKQP